MGPAVEKRQLKLLRQLAREAQYRSDTRIPLDAISDELAIEHYGSGKRFIDRNAPRYEGGSEISYDLNHLVEQRMIKPDYLISDPDHRGGPKYEGEAIRVTPAGIAVVAELERSWLSKAIDKQPITFLQLAFGLFQVLWTAALTWWTLHLTK